MMNLTKCFFIIPVFSVLIMAHRFTTITKRSPCLNAYICIHSGSRKCAMDSVTKALRWFLNKCDVFEFNCEYSTILILLWLATSNVFSHGPPQERDNEDIAMGRKMGPKWCGMAKVCNHDRVSICGISHAGDIMGFKDICDMFDYNCIRRRNYKQTGCPEDKSLLSVSRRPTNNYYDD